MLKTKLKPKTVVKTITETFFIGPDNQKYTTIEDMKKNIWYRLTNYNSGLQKSFGEHLPRRGTYRFIKNQNQVDNWLDYFNVKVKIGKVYQLHSYSNGTAKVKLKWSLT